jgi:hypothetical protein
LPFCFGPIQKNIFEALILNAAKSTSKQVKSFTFAAVTELQGLKRLCGLQGFSADMAVPVSVLASELRMNENDHVQECGPFATAQYGFISL